MVAERSTRVSAPRVAMAAMHLGTPRQPTLAEEIDELEKSERVTAALQAQVDQHGITQHSPKGAQPQGRRKTGVTYTPKRTPKMGNTPDPVRVDKDGKTCTLEDDEDILEEQE